MDDEMMLDSPNSLVAFNDIEELAKWIDQSTVLYLLKHITGLGEHPVSPDTFAAIQFCLASSPVPIDCHRPKSDAELKALWTEVKSADHPYARFLRGMWVPSAHA
ncbi:hypothetical protein B0H17DRAFT_1326163 [Mycena rosella]|uniref:Uncharacterized protein n=1 Tax=Mycena rosella TaxID=1033263 RepID=A0AAD7GU51_MYCRO|nr:hypothetical protein B0H17DRAFT_1326163 [Mycena rosella]